MRPLTPQGRRLCWAVILSVIVITLAFALTDDTPTEKASKNATPEVTIIPPLVLCGGEDDVPVIVMQDSYSLHEGEIHCVHIDVLGGR